MNCSPKPTPRRSERSSSRWSSTGSPGARRCRSTRPAETRCAPRTCPGIAITCTRRWRRFWQPDPERHGSYLAGWTSSDEAAWRRNYRIWDGRAPALRSARGAHHDGRRRGLHLLALRLRIDPGTGTAPRKPAFTRWRSSRMPRPTGRSCWASMTVSGGFASAISPTCWSSQATRSRTFDS